jgi:hypothetical protein
VRRFCSEENAGKRYSSFGFRLPAVSGNRQKCKSALEAGLIFLCFVSFHQGKEMKKKTHLDFSISFRIAGSKLKSKICVITAEKKS